MLEEFKKFALRGNVVDLAVGVIIGAAFGLIVSSMVGDIIMPIIGAVTGGLDFLKLLFAPQFSGKNWAALSGSKKGRCGTHLRRSPYGHAEFPHHRVRFVYRYKGDQQVDEERRSKTSRAVAI